MKNYHYFLFFLLFLTVGCSDDELPPEVKEPPVVNLAGSVALYESGKIEDSYVLINDAGNNRVYIMEKEKSQILYEWDLPSGIGNDTELLDDGTLVAALMTDNPSFVFGGYGGRLIKMAPTGEIVWDFSIADEVNLAHHDIEVLPNGNILVLVWVKKEGEDLLNNGFNGEDEAVYSEKIIEINPDTNEIVWEWNLWDHLIQDVDPTAQNFGVIEDHPERINLNYQDHLKEGSYNGDIFHANGMEYDEERDVIFLTVNYFSEVWVIDHSTTTSQARTGAGGNYGKGGDLIFRFGNPAAYNNTEGERMFYHNHHPNLVHGTDHFLIFSNGIPAVDPHSVVYELKLPEVFDLKSHNDNELEVIWSFRHDELFSAKVSGAERLPNGNTLITEGTYGLWEVTNSGEIVWKFEGEDKSFFWRGYHLEKNAGALQKLGIDQ